MKVTRLIAFFLLTCCFTVVVLGSAIAIPIARVVFQAAEKTLSELPEGDETRLVYQIAAYHARHEVESPVYALYLKAAGKPVYSESALSCYRAAAEEGYAPAQCALGEYYEYGAERDMTKAAEFYRAAAEQGYAPAQGHLGLCYLLGEGVQKDAAEAEKWIAMGERLLAAEAFFARGVSILQTPGGGEERINAAGIALLRALTQYFYKDDFLAIFMNKDEESIATYKQGAASGNTKDEAAVGLFAALGMMGDAADAIGAVQMMRHALRAVDAPERSRALVMGLDSCGQAAALAWLKQRSASGDENAQAVLEVLAH